MLFNLQVLRGVAALGVVFYHTNFRLPGDWHTEFFGVSTFFVISGFIMCFISRDDADGFLRKRLERIVPMYWLCTLALVLFTFKLPIELISGDTPADLFWSLFFLPSDKLPVLPVGWTLNFEIYFYLVFAAGLWLSRRYAPLIVAAFIGSIIWLDGKGFGGFLLHYYSHDYIRYFLAGIATYYVWTFASGFIPRWPAILISTTVIVFCYGSQFAHTAWTDWMAAHLGFAPVAIVASALFLESSGISLNWKPLVLLGNASYSIYLTHTIFFKWAYTPSARMHIPQPDENVWIMVLYVLISAMFGVLVHLYVERPLLRRVRSRKGLKDAQGVGDDSGRHVGRRLPSAG
jgi:exopolysaccharide production protein ExoZ